MRKNGGSPLELGLFEEVFSVILHYHEMFERIKVVGVISLFS